MTRCLLLPRSPDFCLSVAAPMSAIRRWHGSSNRWRMKASLNVSLHRRRPAIETEWRCSKLLSGRFCRRFQCRAVRSGLGHANGCATCALLPSERARPTNVQSFQHSSQGPREFGGCGNLGNMLVVARTFPKLVERAGAGARARRGPTCQGKFGRSFMWV